MIENYQRQLRNSDYERFLSLAEEWRSMGQRITVC